LRRIKTKRDGSSDESNNGITTDKIFNLIEGNSRLTCISISDPTVIQ
jgi:hypothetical protein